MFRSVAVRACRAFSTVAVTARVSAPIVARPILRPQFVRPSIAAKVIVGARCYSAPASLSKQEVESRIMDILKGFDKVTDQTKVTGTSHFANDLGLDSLDTVEVVMAIEEEFSIEIPDKDADAILSVEQAVNYILAQPDGLWTHSLLARVVTDSSTIAH
ncbi:acyl carrier protein [Choiromyces venosus 120613-1]|uniref:Acyl carrier protein n=1 Tax=Choiromyces venosus 120613-1 TaxID=1336337 RepID=A0A3N4JNJ4_9PEZI|nr:acyl carrier protein [Choiromyces venosus 120613-1]